MSDKTQELKLWGAVLLKNKLITDAKWAEFVSEFRKQDGNPHIGDVMLRKEFLSAKVIDVVGRKVEELLAKQKAAGGAPAAGSSSSATSPSPPKPAPPARPAAAPAQASAVSPSSAKPSKVEEIELAGGGGDTSAWKPSDAEWVEATQQQTSTTEKADDEDVARIDLDDTAEPAKSDGASKIIKDERPQVRVAAPSVAARKPSAVAVPAPEIEGDTDARVTSPVAPNDMDPEAFELLKLAVKKGASDLHLSSGTPPFMRLNGTLTFMNDTPLSPERATRMVLGFMDDAQQQHFLKHHDLDFSYEHPDIGRCRVNALEEFRGTDIIFRIIPKKIPTLKELGLPENLEKFTEWHQGLVLVTGPAGCGKSTTAAALINLVNQSRKDHVITVEDPVEFLHISAGCNVTQRQVPIHTASFAAALKGALREDPDVIMIGEMRDLETVSLAIRAAETGHLVIGTLQTKSAARTIDRVVDVFPSDQQAQIRTMLSESLRGIISQQLIPRADGKGRVVALEVLHVNTAVSNLIRDSKTFQLPSLMQTGKKIGQKLMDDSLQELVDANIITKDEARKAAENPKRFV